VLLPIKLAPLAAALDAVPEADLAAVEHVRALSIMDPERRRAILTLARPRSEEEDS